MSSKHAFGSSFRQYSNNRDLKCAECLRRKKAENLESDGYEYRCKGGCCNNGGAA